MSICSTFDLLYNSTCSETFGELFCAAVQDDPQRGSVNFTFQEQKLLETGTCQAEATLDSIAQNGLSLSLFLGSCTNLIFEVFASSGSLIDIAYPVESVAIKIIVGCIVGLYFGIPIGILLYILMIDKLNVYRFFKKTKDLNQGSDVESEATGSDELDIAASCRVPIYLSFHNISFKVKVGRRPMIRSLRMKFGSKSNSRSRRPLKTVLHGLTGVFEPGSLNAIMGPSGSGKTLLLDILADRVHGGILTGKVLLNGRDPTNFFKRVIGYVPRNEAHLPLFTVREWLEYSAELRIVGMDGAAKRKTVDDVISLLDLQQVADTKIGGHGVPGISGGQARRLSVGVELITLPALLFLDEPTTGLDAFNSLQMVQTLRKVANTGRTVLSTIHQPRPDAFMNFDKLFLLKSGKIAYFGSIGDVRAYFESFGAVVEDGVSVADFVVDLTYTKENDESEEDIADALVDHYHNSVYHKEVLELAKALDGRKLPNLPPPAASIFGPCNMDTGVPDLGYSQQRFSQPFFSQISILIRRSVMNLTRDYIYIANLGLQMMQFLFFGLLFLGLRTQQVPTSVGTTIGVTNPAILRIFQKRAFLFQVMNTMVLVEQVVIASTFVEKEVFRTEHASGAYSVFSYHSQLVIRFFAEAVLKGLTAAILCYFFPPLTVEITAFIYFGLILMVCSTMGSGMAMFMVSVIPEAEGAANIHSQLLGTFGLYSGFFLFPNLIPVWMEWLYYILPFKYSFEGLVRNEFQCMTKGEEEYLFSVGPNLSRWGNLLVFMIFPPLFHAGAMFASFVYTRPKSYWKHIFRS